jgi:uncharacterized protein (TIGR02266 family)
MQPAFAHEESETARRRRLESGTDLDRRATRRLPIEIDVTIEGAAHRFTAPTQDISVGGLFLLTFRTIPVDTHVMLAFTLPNGAKLEVLGVVKWGRVMHGDDGEAQVAQLPGLGIAFFCLEPEARATLERFCTVREALY